MADLSVLLELGQRAELVGERHRRIDAVQLVEVDPIHPEPTQAHLDALAEVLGSAHLVPLTRPGPGKAALGGNDEIGWIRVQRLPDEVLAHRGAVGVRSVDQGDAEFDGTSEHPDRLVAISRLTPHAGTRYLHCAVAEPMDRKIAAQGEGAAGRRQGSRTHDPHPNSARDSARGPAWIGDVRPFVGWRVSGAVR